jgi:hypothetical protein
MNDERDKLLLLTAALFAVRLFRAEPDMSISCFSPADQDKVLDGEAFEREEAARRAALDAAAILKAVAEILP